MKPLQRFILAYALSKIKISTWHVLIVKAVFDGFAALISNNSLGVDLTN